MLDDFVQYYELATTSNTRTSPAVRAKNRAREALKKAIRQAVKEHLAHNHLLTDADRDLLGLPVYKTTRTPAPVAESYPDFDIDSSLISFLIIHFYEKDGEYKKAKPAGQHGAEIRWMISDMPVMDANELIHSSFDTRTPFRLEFSGNERGQTVYLALRWENTRGKKGPWSAIKSAIIP
ncbi:MAG: hypothetical protein LBK03_03615 [Bacteroidales bacterium]|nr:hypothetical protein [Bacteroidales bacterium]